MAHDPQERDWAFVTSTKSNHRLESGTTRQEDTMLKLKQVRQQLNCSNSTVKRLIATGDLETVRVNPRTVRVTQAALEMFITARTGRVAPAVRF